MIGEKDQDRVSESQLHVGELEQDFGGESSLPAPPALSAEEEMRLWRKIDLRLMPILSLMYLFSFMDRGQADCLTH